MQLSVVLAFWVEPAGKPAVDTPDSLTLQAFFPGRFDKHRAGFVAIEAPEKNAKALEHAKRQLAYKTNKTLEAAKNFAAKLEALTVSLTAIKAAARVRFTCSNTDQHGENHRSTQIDESTRRLVFGIIF